MSDYFRRNTELSPEDIEQIPNRSSMFWEDYIGYSNGMVHFRHGSYRLEDIVNAMYPDPNDSRRSAVMLRFSGY